MLETDRVTTAPAPPLDTADPRTGLPNYEDGYSTGSATLSQTTPLATPITLPRPPLLPQPIPGQPPCYHTPTMPGSGGGKVGEDGGRVMVHWTQSGPSVQPLAASSAAAAPAPAPDHRSSLASPDAGDDLDDDDDELLAPAPPRERLSYTRYQLELLNGIFDCVRYPNSVQKQLIAKRVGISREQVKIWFQNRRRKDVVLNKTTTTSTDSSTSPTSSHDPTSPSAAPGPSPPSSDRAHNGQCADDGGRHSSEEGGGCDGQDNAHRKKMVPDAVINGCISELRRFSDEKLKERKEKRKAKGKRRAHAAAPGPRHAGQAALPGGGAKTTVQSGVRLFQAYDMVAPPNKVTPTAAYLDTSTNRFNHSHNSSAFSSPRDSLAAASTLPRLAWDGVDTGMSQALNGSVTDQLAHARGYGGLGMAGLGVGLVPTSQPQNVASGSQDNLPVLADLLSYRSPSVEGGGGGAVLSEASLPQPSLLVPSSPDPGSKLLELGSSNPHHHHHHHAPNNGTAVPPSPFGVNPRVYPFPFIADPPIMLSSLHQHNSTLHHPWPHPHPAPPPSGSAHFNPMVTMNGMDPYKPVMISSLNNPYFSTPPHASPHWPAHPHSVDPASGVGFPQHSQI